VAKKKSLKLKSSKARKNSRFLLFVLAGLVLGVVYYFNNSYSASTNDAAKVSEVFDEIVVSPNSYKIQLVDENGAPLKQELINKISVASMITGKDCGPKGSTVTHPKGGCFSVDKPDEVAVPIGSDATASFQSKLFHVNQTFEYSNKKQKKYDYYFSGIGSGTNFVAWKTNTIVIRSADKKEEIARLSINSNVYFQKKLDKAQDDIVNLNSAVKTIKIPSNKITSSIGPDEGIPATTSTTTTETANKPVLSANAISSNSVSVKFVKSRGGDIIPGQPYEVYNWYYECTITTKKESSCTKLKKYYGEKGIAGIDGIAKFKTELINVGDNYFIGETISSDKFRIWSKSEVVAVNEKSKKVGIVTVVSPFSRFKFLFFGNDSTKRDSNKQKMIDKYDSLFKKEYKIRVR